jgi:hypothetical protein
MKNCFSSCKNFNKFRKNKDSKICIDKEDCDSYISSDEETCVNNCSQNSEYFFNDDGKVLKNCINFCDYFISEDNTTCVTKCSYINQLTDLTTNKCITKCPSNLFYTPEKNSCSKKCEVPYCKLCDKETHSKHEFCNIKEFFLSEKEEQKAQFIIIKLNQINNDLLCKIFNTIINDKLDYSNTIYKYRQSEISLYTLMKNEYNINKSKNYNLLLNIRNYILKKFESINNLSYIEFIKETKVPEEKIQAKDSLIQYLLGKKYINFDNIPYNDDNNFFILKDKLYDIYIDHFLLLKNDIFITSGPNCYIYDESMEVKLKFTVGDKNNQKNIIISYIHYKKYNEMENTEIIYAFITGIIYEVILLKDGKDNYSYEIIEHRNKRISHKVDGVIDMKNGDVIVCSHMYPVICWRKDENKKFFEYKVLTEQKPYIKNAINIIHLSDDEFVTTSNSWPSLKFYLYQGDSDKTKEEYKIIKDIKLHCSKRKNTLALWNKEIINRIIYLS